MSEPACSRVGSGLPIRRRGAPAVLVAVLAVGWGCGPGLRSESFDAARQAAISDSVRATLDAFVATIEAGDWEALGDFYADDARFRWMEDGRVMYDSRQAVVQSLVEVGGSFTHGTLEYTDLDVTPLAPGVAAFTSHFKQTLIGANGGGFSFSGVIGATLVHAPEGWKFLLGHTSTSP